MDEKRRLFEMGLLRMNAWCEANAVIPPQVVENEQPVDFGTCAFYRDDVITIHVRSCASIGRTGMAWSYPGYVVDRTPYGVLAHELGHHLDEAHGPRGGIRARTWQQETNEPAITSYAPNVNEWFAEIFRLFVTNPDLLRLIRPRMFVRLNDSFKSVESRSWDEVLIEARQQNAARNKIKACKTTVPPPQALTLF